MLKKILLLLAFAATLLPFSAIQAQSTPQIVVERGVAMKTRDGVTLRADIYRPAADGQYPVLLTRTPYNKDNSADFGRKAAARGYIVVVQDVRGRYTSEGEWYTFKHESDDGYDTVEWAAALPHSNGKVGMFSGSYVGATQMLAAIAHPPHLAGICPVVTASNYHENWTYQGGAFEQWFNESWTSGLAQDTLDRVIRENTNARVGSSVLPLSQYPVFNVPAPQNAAALTSELAPYFLDWLAHPTYDDYWKQWSIEEHYQNIMVPALTMAAWYDIFQGGSLRNYLGLKAHAGAEAARNGQRLLVAIGGHAGGGRRIGAVDFGPSRRAIRREQHHPRLVRLPVPRQAERVCRRIQAGQNLRHGQERMAQRDELADSSGPSPPATSCIRPARPTPPRATARFSRPPRSPNPPTRYVYDPANPVPTVGGPLCCDASICLPVRATRGCGGPHRRAGLLHPAAR